MQLADGSEVEVGAELGRGSGAVVREGVWRGKPVAVKVCLRLGLGLGLGLGFGSGFGSGFGLEG